MLDIRPLCHHCAINVHNRNITNRTMAKTTMRMRHRNKYKYSICFMPTVSLHADFGNRLRWISGGQTLVMLQLHTSRLYYYYYNLFMALCPGPPRWAIPDWLRLTEQGLTSHQTHYRSYQGWVLKVKWSNQQRHSTRKDKPFWMLLKMMG